MKKFRKMAVVLTAILMILAFSATAYADGGGAAEPVPTTIPVPTPEPTKEANPFTPAGTGTVVDTATDEDGKEFYTITTADESVFYLVIDLQRATENVYFLNSVTVEDLLALAETPDAADTPTLPAPTPETTPEATPAPQAEQPASTRGGNAGMFVFMLVVALAVGAAGYYFKIYLPKKQRAESEEEAEYTEPAYDEGEDGDDLPPWEDEEEDEA